MISAHSIFRRARLRGFGLAAAAVVALFGASAVQARGDVAPYLEVQQVLTADLNDGGDVLTYTSVAAGVDARVTTRRVEAQISYRYERRIGWDDNLADEDVHSGLAQARIEVVDNLLSLDAGAIATRSRDDAGGGASGFTSSDSNNVAEVYGIYAGPTLATHAGPVAVNASYRLGYVYVDDHSLAGSDRYESSLSHHVAVSAGIAPGELPVGVTVTAGYDREDSDRLDATFEDKYVRGDVVVPVSATLAVTGGVGYEKLEASQKDILRDANGSPVLTSGGNLVADSSKPRLIAYDQSGLIWDAGVIWRPSPRTELQARVGRRYGGTTVFGTLQHQFDEHLALSALVYDGVSSFGRSVINDVSSLPANFKVKSHGLNSGFASGGGCIFGTQPGSGACLDDAFQSISNYNFRSRGANVLLSGDRGPWNMQLGASYARRKYLAADIEGVVSMDGVEDQSVTVEGLIGRKLTHSSGIDLEGYANWFDSGVSGSENIFSAGATATYYRSFLWEQLQGQASVGLYSTDTGDGDNSVTAAAMLGLRYQF